MALKRAVWVWNTSQKSQVTVSDYSDAPDERQLDCAFVKSLVDWFFVRYSVERNSKAKKIAELHHHQLLAIDGNDAALRRVSLLLLYPRAIKPTKRSSEKPKVAHFIILINVEKIN